ncbi:hypothetical protein [Mameliella sediminis]|uniref:hypothetical protein n=1 Tax=Mameliella sediminis TaxID=2836866 RepID=UPI001C4940FD|nr:hypothetical protein [Mameliella sediminis]MBV7394550.1 hypothetical protein [Mameliella sediminis]
MSRNVDSALLAEISKPFFFPVFLVFVDWPSDPVYAHSGVGDISFDGQTWAGVAGYASIALPAEQRGTAADTAAFSLVGVPDDLASLVTEDARDIDCAVWFGAVTQRAGTALIGTPQEIFRGRGDQMRESIAASDLGRTRSLRLGATTGPSQRLRSGLFHTSEQHQRSHPGDTLLRHAAGVEAAFVLGVENQES